MKLLETQYNKLKLENPTATLDEISEMLAGQIGYSKPGALRALASFIAIKRLQRDVNKKV